MTVNDLLLNENFTAITLPDAEREILDVYIGDLLSWVCQKVADGKGLSVTEDEEAGLEYYQHFYRNKVISSHGNSNLSKYGNEETLLIGDGCAIGAFIQDLMLTKAKLYLPESFEWKLLQNGMFYQGNNESKNIKAIENIGTEYPSIERYCAVLLAEITRNTPAQYTKSKLNQCYMEPCCCKNTKCEFFSRNKKLG